MKNTADLNEICVVEAVSRFASLTPNASAVVCQGAMLAYAELETRASRLAVRLLEAGAGPEVRIGLCLDRSIDLPVAMLAILKANAAFVPLDVRQPLERLARIAEDAQLALILADTHHLALAAAIAPAAARLSLIDSGNRPAGPIKRPATALAKQLAYVMYTSGSTGRPRGVAVERRNLSGFLAAMSRIEKFDGARFAAIAPIAFDISLLEIFLPLALGGTVILFDDHFLDDPPSAALALTLSGASVIQGTPATWRLLLDGGWRPTGQVLLCGGDALPQGLALELLRSDGPLFNLYGPTEATIWSTVARITDDRAIVIGRPLANTRCYVLDKYGLLAPPGAVGELYLSGSGVARGYLGDEGSHQFLANPFDQAGHMMYRTGDLVRWTPQGELEFRGRVDNQLKLRGYRIEAGDVEAALVRHSDIQEAAVTLESAASLDAQLVAYYTSGRSFVRHDLDDHLRQILPAYMIPQRYVRLDRLPINDRGKLDRMALKRRRELDPAFVAPAPQTPTEKAVSQVWEEVMGRSGLHRGSDFFDLGGHSLLALRLASAMSKVFGRTIPVFDLLQAPTIEAISRRIDETALV
jgi:amino acid adenylation domain-containing protein